MNHRQQISAVVRVSTGNFLEMYDFMVFGYYAAAIGRAFFPTQNEYASLMLSFMTFGTGYLMRPLGAIVLGVIICWSGDFAMQWQPVPDGFPLRMPLAILSGVLLIAGGAGLLLPSWQRQSALLLTLNYAFWTVVLHGWRVLGDPGVLIEWNGIAEIGFVTCGAVALYASSGPSHGDTLRKWARLMAGTFARRRT